ncbi:beta-propeller fold lactonase family protein [Marihabitans asiaticum]|uniref:6-phosphogluconolactonase (Cycloisomerase 2 family) n=1 Tax=Marihabitans asiaticum TaxID=415218 RepID=A0A560WEA6_9MICO|nr:beta-propeller fold lactonase family protein [Marihabitans asiaticum]TWD15997.1 6-phosphogluconolactonase (cycloisomerase 2 family) [Marihabitans asiaticum]
MTAMWIGCYTGEMGEGEGVTRVDLSTGRQRVVTGGVPSPSWLVPVGDGVLAVSESEGGELTLLGPNGSLAAGRTGAGWPCHAARLTPSLLAVAHYGTGRVTTVELTDGAPGRVVDEVDLGGLPLGPRADRQDGSHPHQVVLDETRGEVLVPDLGADVVHRLALREGRLTRGGDVIEVPPGFGPRHLMLAGDLLLVVGELSSELWLGRWDEAKGWQQLGQRPSLVEPVAPDESSDEGGANLPSAVRLTDDDHVLVGNRGADRVSVFALDRGAGSLTAVRDVPAHGAWPRDLVVDGDDVWVACERGHAVTRVRWRGPGAGRLGERIATGSPTAVVLG